MRNFFLSGYVVRYGAASERKSSRFSTPFCYLFPYDVAAMAECKASLLHTDKIHKEDIVELEGRRYIVTGVNDTGNLHLCTDLSLREE